MGLNEPSEALKWLANAREDHCCWLLFAPRDPNLTPLRTESRFGKLTENVKLFST